MIENINNIEIILFAILTACAVILVSFNFFIFYQIKKHEIKFFNNEISLQSDFGTKLQKLPWVILFGKYKKLENATIKIYCSMFRVIFIFDWMVLLIFVALIFYRALSK